MLQSVQHEFPLRENFVTPRGCKKSKKSPCHNSAITLFQNHHTSEFFLLISAKGYIAHIDRFKKKQQYLSELLRGQVGLVYPSLYIKRTKLNQYI